jgi:hypothetical protein
MSRHRFALVLLATAARRARRSTKASAAGSTTQSAGWRSSTRPNDATPIVNSTIAYNAALTGSQLYGSDTVAPLRVAKTPDRPRRHLNC